MKITIDPISDSNGFFTIRPFDGSPHGDTDEQPIAIVFAESDAQTIAAAVTACHGLELPVNVPPGALDEIVTAARALLEVYDLRGYGCGDEAQALEDTLAKLDPPPADPKPKPKPKPYAYAVKTAEGYVANQGDQWWHESEPVGWALIGLHESALRIAYAHRGEVVPVFKR